MLAAVKLLWSGVTPMPVDRDYVAKLPYASMLARLNEGPWALLVLAEGQQEGYGWYSAEKQMLATAGPWVVRTIGLDADIDSVKNFNINPYDINIANIAPDFIVTRRLDSISLRRFDLEIRSSFENRGIEEVEILGYKYQLALVVERGTIPALNVNFESRFWVDPVSGYCWRSEQSSLPDFAKITYEIAKPPAA